LHRNFQGYSTRAECDLIGLGVSAIGNVGDTYSQNAKSLPEYYATLDQGRLPIQRGIKLDLDDLIRRDVIQQIMCQNSIDLVGISERFHIDFNRHFVAEVAQLELLARDGLIELDNEWVAVTPQGRLLVRNIASVFDAYSARNSEPLYSKAI